MALVKIQNSHKENVYVNPDYIITIEARSDGGVIRFTQENMQDIATFATAEQVAKQMGVPLAKFTGDDGDVFINPAHVLQITEHGYHGSDERYANVVLSNGNQITLENMTAEAVAKAFSTAKARGGR